MSPTAEVVPEVAPEVASNAGLEMVSEEVLKALGTSSDGLIASGGIKPQDSQAARLSARPEQISGGQVVPFPLSSRRGRELGSTESTESSPGAVLEPVDQAVGDMDLLSESLRRVQTGLRGDGEQTSVFRWVDPRQTEGWSGASRPTLPAGQQGPNVYFRLAPGVVAQVDRLEYLVRVGEKQVGLNIQPRRDGEFIEMPSANTVFHLSWPPAVEIKGAEPQIGGPPGGRDGEGTTNTGPIDSRLNYRVDTRVDTRLDGRVGGIGSVGEAVSNGEAP